VKPIALLSIALAALCSLETATAQAPNQALAASIVAARQKNAALMKQYSWNCRIEVIENGQVKDTRIDLVNFGPEGNLQYTLLNDQSSALPRGFLRRRLAEKERQRMDQYFKDIRALLNEYTLPTSTSVGTFLATATIQAPDANGLLQITGGSVVKPGDTLSLWASAPGGQIHRMKAMTFYEGDDVTVSASFQTLSSGLSYMAYATVSIPAQSITVQVQNFDYVNQNN
jgi:hypothetical protein